MSHLDIFGIFVIEVQQENKLFIDLSLFVFQKDISSIDTNDEHSGLRIVHRIHERCTADTDDGHTSVITAKRSHISGLLLSQ